MRVPYVLSDAEWEKLKQVYNTLMILTEAHCHTCDCELCVARSNVNTDDASFRTIEFEPFSEKDDPEMDNI